MPAPIAPAPLPPAPVAAERPAKKRRRVGWIIAVSLLSAALLATGAFLVLSLMRLDDAHDLIDKQKELIDEKETFGAAMEDLLSKAGEFDGVLFGTLVPDDRFEVLASLGWKDRWDAGKLSDDTADVRSATSDLDVMLAGAEEQATTNDSKSKYEKVIDKLGDGWVTTAIDNADKLCKDDVWGCVVSDDPYTIHIDKSDVKQPYITDFIRTGLSYHEFAHVLQFTNPGVTSTTVEVFDDDYETMADCFALTYLDGWKLDHRVWVSDFEYYDVSVGYGYTCNSKERKAIRTWYEQLGYQSRPIEQ